MGSRIMVLIQVILLHTLAITFLIAEKDWEKENYGIRTVHHKDELIENINIDENAPKLDEKKHRYRFSNRRKHGSSSDITVETNSSERSRGRSLEGDEMKNEKPKFRFRGRKTLKRGKTSAEMRDKYKQETKQELNLIREKPSFAKFKQRFMEKSNNDHNQSLEQSEDNQASIASTTDSLVSHSLEKDMSKQEESLENVELKETVDVAMDSEGQNTKEVKDLNSKSRYQIRVRPKSGHKRPSLSDEYG